MKVYTLLLVCSLSGFYSFGQPSSSSTILPESASFKNSAGTGYAGHFLIDGSTSNASYVLGAETYSLGPAGYFYSHNPGSFAPTIYGMSMGGGKTLEALNRGTGLAAEIAIQNVSNPNYALVASTFGSGGAGNFLITSSNSSPAIGVNIQTSSAGLGLKSVTTGTSGAGWLETNNTINKAPTLYVVHRGRGRVGYFETTHGSNDSTTFTAISKGNGRLADFEIKNTSNASNAISAVSNGSGTVLRAQSNGTSRAGEFFISNSSNASQAIYAYTSGPGNTIESISNGGGNAIRAVSNGWGGTGHFEINFQANSATALKALTNGSGNAGYFQSTNVNSPSAALYATSTGANTFEAWHSGVNKAAQLVIDNTGSSSTAVFTKTNGSGITLESHNTGSGKAGHFQIINAGNSSSGIYVATNGTGQGGEFYTTNTNNTNTTLYAKTQGTGKAGHFEVESQFSTNPALYAVSNSDNGAALMAQTTNTTGDIAVFKDQSNSNVARVDYQGKGYFNGGTQNHGADLAEAFEVEGEKNDYEPGDVLVISESTDRTVEKSNQPYSTLIAGVYATKPGVLLREDDINNDLGEQVPMGVVGVIPTKVCNEGGKIKRGDLLVTSSKTGYAMKADPARLGFGQDRKSVV